MSLLDIFRPSWKHSKATVRKKAAEKIKDQDILTYITLNDKDDSVRLIAFKFIKDQDKIVQLFNSELDLIKKIELSKAIGKNEILVELIKLGTTAEIRLIATCNLVRINCDKKYLTSLANNFNYQEVKDMFEYYIAYCDQNGIEKTIESAQSCLEQIPLAAFAITKVPVKTHFEYGFGKEVPGIGFRPPDSEPFYTQDSKKHDEAVSKISNPVLLKEIAKNAENEYISYDIIRWKIKDESSLKDIFINAKNPDVRLKVLYYIQDINFIIDYAQDDKVDWKIRESAVKRITNETVLSNIIKSAKNEKVRAAAQDELDKILMMKIRKSSDQKWLEELVFNHKKDKIRIHAIKKIKNLDTLIKITESTLKSSLRKEAIKKINSQDDLYNIYSKNTDNWIKLASVKQITDQDKLKEILNIDQNTHIRKAVIEGITEQEVLSQIADSEENPSVRIAAIEKLTDKTILEKLANPNYCMHEKIVNKASYRIRHL